MEQGPATAKKKKKRTIGCSAKAKAGKEAAIHQTSERAASVRHKTSPGLSVRWEIHPSAEKSFQGGAGIGQDQARGKHHRQYQGGIKPGLRADRPSMRWRDRDSRWTTPVPKA